MFAPTLDRVDDLRAQLVDEDPRVRLEAAHSLANLGDGALPALDALTLAVDDEDGEVRLAAVEAIGAIDPRETESALAWAIQSDDYRVQVAVQTLISGSAKLRGPDSTLWRDPSIGRDE